MSEEALPHPDLVAAIPRLRRYARALTGEASRADDLVQDTLARAWEKRRLWQAGTDLRAWLFTVMHNVFVNQRARARRDARNVSLDDDGEGGEAWRVAVRPGQQARVELVELLGHVGRLPAEQREVLLLAAVEEMKPLYDLVEKAPGVQPGLQGAGVVPGVPRSSRRGRR